MGGFEVVKAVRWLIPAMGSVQIETGEEPKVLLLCGRRDDYVTGLPVVPQAAPPSQGQR